MYSIWRRKYIHSDVDQYTESVTKKAIVKVHVAETGTSIKIIYQIKFNN